MANDKDTTKQFPLMPEEPTGPGEKKAQRGLLITMGIVLLLVIVFAIVGFLFLNNPPEIIEGQVDGTTVKVSGKLPGRVVEFYVQEGDTVHQGDTLVRIHSAEAEAQLGQAEAIKSVAEAAETKVDAGTRSQIISAAHDLWTQAKAASEIAQKTYTRMENLYKEGVISEQKRDEAKAAYDAAVAGEKAAKSNYDLAVAGAQKEDKAAAAAMVNVAGGGVNVVEALLEDAYLTAPCDGTVDQVYPEVGELVAMGAPIINLLKSDDRWVVFNVREELLNDFRQGKTIKVHIPALGNAEYDMKVYYLRDMGTYATWRSTKSTGHWDSRTFQVKARPDKNIPDLRPGMSAIYKK